MVPAKPRDRKCATCRFYEPSPLWRKGWCRNPLLYDAQTNHLVEADSLACSRTFIDYWEARDPNHTGAPLPPEVAQPVRRAPSIPMAPTGPGGAPLVNHGPTVAAVQASATVPRQRASRLALVRAEEAAAGASLGTGGPETRALPLSGMEPDPAAAAPAPPPADLGMAMLPEAVPAAPTRPNPVRPRPAAPAAAPRRWPVVLLLLALIAAGGGFLALRPNVKGLVPGQHPSPTATLAPPVGSIFPTATAAPTRPPTPRPTPRRVATPAPPTPAAPAMAPGHNAQLSGLTSGNLNIRQLPTLKGRVIGSLKPGTTIHLVAGPQAADGVQWWQITGWDSRGTAGWASGKYLKPVP